MLFGMEKIPSGMNHWYMIVKEKRQACFPHNTMNITGDRGEVIGLIVMTVWYLFH